MSVMCKLLQFQGNVILLLCSVAQIMHPQELLSIEYRRNHKHIFVVSKYAIGIVGVNMPFEFSRFEVIPN